MCFKIGSLRKKKQKKIKSAHISKLDNKNKFYLTCKQHK